MSSGRATTNRGNPHDGDLHSALETRCASPGDCTDQSDWRDPQLPGASLDINWYIDNARAAEAAKFDQVFIVDSPFITPYTAPVGVCSGLHLKPLRLAFSEMARSDYLLLTERAFSLYLQSSLHLFPRARIPF